MKVLVVVSALVFLEAAGDTPPPRCPEPYGLFPDEEYCDKYLECRNGTGVQNDCPDGLYFNDRSHEFRYPCDYPPDVDCGTRTKLQPPQSTPECPHQFAVFFSGDEAHCDRFTSCVYGIAYPFRCPGGLAFSPHTLRCEWPDDSFVCDPDKYLGFRCPDYLPSVADVAHFEKFPHPDPKQCNQFFICLQNHGRWAPRLQSCDQGQAFDPVTLSCVDLSDAPDCVLDR